MCERAKLSDCAYCEYYKVGDARLAASLNAANIKVRGRKVAAIPAAEEEEERAEVAATNNA